MQDEAYHTTESQAKTEPSPTDLREFEAWLDQIEAERIDEAFRMDDPSDYWHEAEIIRAHGTIRARRPSSI